MEAQTEQVEHRTNGHTGETQQHQLPAQVRAPITTGAAVAAIVPRTFEDVQRIANVIVRSGLAPRDLNSIERVTVAIMHGMEIGLKPLAAVQRIAVINGRPSVWGDAVPAIAFGTGQVAEFDERIEGQGDEMTAVCRVVRRIHGVIIAKETRFSVADAKQAGLWDEREKVTRRGRDGSSYEAKNDSPWHRYPKRMMAMRARSAIRDLFADAMCGLYIAEELVGRDSDAEMRDITPTFDQVLNPLGGEPVREPVRQIDEEAFREDPQEARQEPAGVSDGKPDGNQPANGKASPAPANGVDGAKTKTTRARKTKAEAASTPKADASPPQDTDERFPEPWIQQSAQSYMEYCLRWMGKETDLLKARERFAKEQPIRNGLREPLDEPQKIEIRAAMSKIGTVAQ